MDINKMGGHRRLNENEFWALMNNKSQQATHSRTWLGTLHLWWDRAKERRQMAKELRAFPDEVLQDFGMTRDQAHALVNKPFWLA